MEGSTLLLSYTRSAVKDEGGAQCKMQVGKVCKVRWMGDVRGWWLKEVSLDWIKAARLERMIGC